MNTMLPIPDLTAKDIWRFWHFTDLFGEITKDKCILWTASTIKSYKVDRPCFRIKEVTYLASRVCYKLYYKEDPKDKCVCHVCDNAMCVNPLHLFLGSHQNNMSDKISKGLQIKGEEIFNSKITENIVRQIRKDYVKGESQKSIGARYGLVQQHISDIINYKRWGHVQ